MPYFMVRLPKRLRSWKAIEIAQVKALNKFLNTLNEDKEGLRACWTVPLF